MYVIYITYAEFPELRFIRLLKKMCRILLAGGLGVSTSFKSPLRLGDIGGLSTLFQHSLCDYRITYIFSLRVLKKTCPAPQCVRVGWPGVVMLNLVRHPLGESPLAGVWWCPPSILIPPLLNEKGIGGEVNGDSGTL